MKLRPKEDGITMPDGRDVFMHACKYMVDALEHVAHPHGLALQDLDYIICHQANMRIVANVIHQLKMPSERFLSNISELGNTGSASAALVFAQNRGSLRKVRISVSLFLVEGILAAHSLWRFKSIGPGRSPDLNMWDI